MKSKNLNILFILAVMMFCSCTKNSSTIKDAKVFKESSIAEKIKLTGSVMYVDSLIMHPVTIDIQDTLLFLKNLGTEYIYDVYNLNNKKLINQCLKMGNGPLEKIYPVIAQLSDTSVWIYDRAKLMLAEYKTADFLSLSQPEPIQSFKYKKEFDSVVLLPNHTILASYTDKSNNRFHFCTLTGDSIKSIGGEHSLEKKDKSDLIQTIRLHSYMASNLKDRIFVCYLFTDIVEIFDFQGNLINRLHGPHQHLSIMKQVSAGGDYVGAATSKNETYHCYSFPEVVGEEIFVFYFGDLSANFRDKQNLIYVFDWDGNPLKIYELDIPIGAFTIDYKNRIIYGISNSPEYSIIQYKY